LRCLLSTNRRHYPLLIATGGSSIYREEINSLAKKSLTVHLFSRKKTLANRIGDATKRGVVFPDGISFDELYEQRMPLYNKLADLNFSTDSRRGNQQQLTNELIKLVDQKIEQNELDEKWMSLALDIARQAESNGEVPIGAVLVSDGKVIGKSGNKTISLCDATAHAEMVAIREACQFIGNHRLSNSTLYVTLEPCSMCAGAIIQARIPRVLYAALDSKAGAVQSNFQLLNDERLNHQCEVYQGLYEETASQMLRDFFKRRR